MSAVFVVIFSFKSITTYKNTTEGGCWWLTPTILDTQEDEIGRNTVWGQSRQIVCETPSQSVLGCRGVHLSYQAIWEAEIWKILVPGQLGQS
jgi:hypothetical protein